MSFNSFAVHERATTRLRCRCINAVTHGIRGLGEMESWPINQICMLYLQILFAQMCQHLAP